MEEGSSGEFGPTFFTLSIHPAVHVEANWCWAILLIVKESDIIELQLESDSFARITVTFCLDQF